MLTSRGAVARLSKRAFNSARQTNALFSSAALPRVALPAQSQQTAGLSRPQASSSNIPGKSFRPLRLHHGSLLVQLVPMRQSQRLSLVA